MARYKPQESHSLLLPVVVSDQINPCRYVDRDAHAVIDEANAAGVYVFGGGIDEDVPPIRVSADYAVAMGAILGCPRSTARPADTCTVACA